MVYSPDLAPYYFSLFSKEKTTLDMQCASQTYNTRVRTRETYNQQPL